MKNYERFEVQSVPCTVPTYAGFAAGTAETPRIYFERVQCWSVSRLADRVVGCDDPFYLGGWGMVSNLDGLTLAENSDNFVGYYETDIETEDGLANAVQHWRCKEILAEQEIKDARKKEA